MALTTFDYRYGLLYQESAVLRILVNFILLAFTAGLIVMLQSRIRHIGQVANQDALTGAMNRTAIQQFAESTLERAKTDGRKVIVAVIDCDGFKAVNDRYGHQAGDEILIALVKVLERMVCRAGAVGRIGGDEFVVVFEDRSESFVMRFLDNAKKTFVDETAAISPDISFSSGIAEFGPGGQSYGELVQCADAKMYAAKAEGGDRRAPLLYC
jgi:diguanylate cyclase (GGDEF)-like protein